MPTTSSIMNQQPSAQALRRSTPIRCVLPIPAFLHHNDFIGDDVAPDLPDAVDVGNLDLADPVSRPFEIVGAPLERRAHRRIDVHVAWQSRKRNLDTSFRLRPDQRRRNPPGIAWIALAHDLEREPYVCYAARERSLRRH